MGMAVLSVLVTNGGIKATCIKKMIRFLFINLLLSLCAVSIAQDRSGITGARDTSYSIAKEYKKHLKNYPYITVVPDTVSDRIKEERNITYCKIGERELKIDVFYPADKRTKKRTAIIFIHGGGWRSGDKAMHHQLMQRLVLLGYVCFTPEYRLSTEALYPAAVHDIKSSVRWVRKKAKKYNIDTAAIVVASHSAGGQLAALVGVTNDNFAFENVTGNGKFSSRVDAVIDVDGTLSFVQKESSEINDRQKRGASSLWLGYTPAENIEIFSQASPLSHVGTQSPPILFLNSSVERMHAGRDEFIKVLNTGNIYSGVKTFEGAPHAFCFFRPWFEPMVLCIDDFLKKIFTAK